MPDASSARATFEAHRPTIEALDRELRAEVARLPHREVVRCEDPAAVAASNDAARNARFEACTRARGAWLTSVNAAMTRLRRDVLPGWIDAHHDVLGIAVVVRSRGESQHDEARIGNTSPLQLGVDPSGGVGVDGYRVGWHLFQTAFAFVPRGESEYAHYGGGEHRPGIEVGWSFTDGDASVDASLIVLAEDETEPEWRAGQRRAAIPRSE
jgi:hypothetical protein